jgi:hypothetical protein
MVPIAQRKRTQRPQHIRNNIEVVKLAVNLPLSAQAHQRRPVPARRHRHAYRQQPLHDLARNSKPKRDDNECVVYHFPPGRLEDPVERQRQQEEGDEVQRFVGLLVRWRDIVFLRGEAARGGNENEGCEGSWWSVSGAASLCAESGASAAMAWNEG